MAWSFIKKLGSRRRSEEERPPMNLPEEMLTEILLKLPVDSLLRLSCVCKAWRDLIGDPFFVEKHLKQNRNSVGPMIFFRRYSKNENDLETEDLLFTPKYKDDDASSKTVSRRLRKPPLPAMRALGSCNGIVFLVDNGYSKEVHLCNPCTGEDRQLPRHDLRDKSRGFGFCFGFGFDASTKDYKVVAIENRKLNVENHAEVYKLSTDCWSEVIISMDSNIDLNCDGVFVNGFYHWWTRKNTIFTFDFKNEIFGTMHFPRILDSKNDCKCMNVVDDSLAICFTDPSEVVFDVWVMTEYGNSESWMKKFSTQISTGFYLHGVWPVHDLSQLMVLGVRDDFQHLEACLLDLKFRDTTLLEIEIGDFLSGVFFKPSLVSLRL